VGYILSPLRGSNPVMFVVPFRARAQYVSVIPVKNEYSVSFV
jgi:hypothetical protein